MVTRSISGFVFVLLLLAGRAPAQDVLVVGPAPGPGIDFVVLQQAIAAAADGDTIVVLPGEYDNQVLLQDRQLVLAGVVGPKGERPILASLVIRDLAADHSIVLRGFELRPFVFGPEILKVQQCAGAVLLEDCVLNGEIGVMYDEPAIIDSDHVVLARCYLEGPRGFPTLLSTSTPGGSGLRVTSSSVTLYDCSLVGGQGANAEIIFPIHAPSSVGGLGATVSGGTLFVAGSTLTGGAGGAGKSQGSLCFPPSDGGAGLVLHGLLRRLDTSLAGGAPGASLACGPPAAPGVALVQLGGSIVEIPQTLRRFSLSSPVEPGGIVALDISGAPSEPVVLLQALAPLGQWLGGLKGTLAGAPHYTVFALGLLGPAGTLHIDFAMPLGVLPPGLESLLIVDQLVTPAAGGGGLLSAPSTLVLVDDLP